MSAEIRRAALNLLARRDHSEKELMRKLRMRQFAEDEIRNVIAELSQKNLLSNDRFIENYILYRRHRGYGPLRIKAELLEKGITEDLIEDKLKIHDNAWLIEAKQVWKKKFRNQAPQDSKERMQQWRFLVYRGFTEEHIKQLKDDDY